jgi:hypothetical protein
MPLPWGLPCTHYITEHYNKTNYSESELVIKSNEITVHARTICFIYCGLQLRIFCVFYFFIYSSDQYSKFHSRSPSSLVFHYSFLGFSFTYSYPAIRISFKQDFSVIMFMKTNRMVLQKDAKLLSLSVQTVFLTVTSKFNVVLLCCDLTIHKRNTKRKRSQIRHINLNTDISKFIIFR